MLDRAPEHLDFKIYKPRNPQSSEYYRCVEAHFEELIAIWDERYISRYGFWRPHVMEVIHRYLECGDLHFGFARVRCDECGHDVIAILLQAETLLPFMSSKAGCGIRRVALFGSFESDSPSAMGL